MFEDRELAGFSGEERAVARAELQKSIESLDIFERKLMIAWADERLSNVASMLIKSMWHGHISECQLAMCSRGAREAHAKAMILAHISFGRTNTSFMKGDSRARLVTLTPNVGLMPIEAMELPLAQLRGYADRAARIVRGNALFMPDLALFCPSRGAPVDIAAVHVHGTIWIDDPHFKPTGAAKAMGEPGGVINALGAPIAVIRTRGRRAGNALAPADVAGLGRYGSKISCGVNTCFDTKRGRRSECSQTDWRAIDALRQLEFWSHISALDMSWGVGEGKLLRKLWRARLITLTTGELFARQPIPHQARTDGWQDVWRALGTSYSAISVKKN